MTILTNKDGPRTPLGWAKPERLQHLKDLLQQAGLPTTTIQFRGEQLDLKVIRVPLELPKYRLRNGRTAALQEEYIASNKLSPDYFRRDDELIEVQEAQHGLLEQLITEEGLDKYFGNSSNKQTDPLILSSEGIVVNGNRRLCTFRELHQEDSSTYSHFATIRVVVLPIADEKAIDELEAKLQLHPDLRAKYTWYARAQMMRDRQEFHGLTSEQLAGLYDVSKTDLEELLEMHRLASEYLASRGRTSKWSSLGGKGEYAFQQIVKGGKKISSGDDMRLFKAAAFLLVDDPTEGRLYEQIPNLQKHLPEVKEQLVTTIPIKKVDGTESAPSDPDDPLAPSSPEAISSDDVAKAISADENKEAAITQIREAIDAANESEREKRNANYLLQKLVRVHSQLNDAVKNGIHPDTNVDGVAEQLALIEKRVDEIREHLARRDFSTQN